MVRTLDDAHLEAATVGVRIDVNSPMDGPDSLADDARLQAHVDTLSELANRGAAVVVLAHQGRPGGDQFHSLSAHAKRFGELLEVPVAHVDATFSRDARKAVSDLAAGSILLLENVRFYSEEYMEFEPERAARTHLVAALAPLFDCYVNDAFAAAHRSQPSLVGFPVVLPAYAGRVMERELSVLGTLESSPRPRTYVLGGAKVEDSLEVAWSVLERDLADHVLTTGLVGNVFLFADGVDLGDASASVVEDRCGWATVERARDLLDAHGDRISLARDVALEGPDGRLEVGVNALPGPVDGPALDVGSATADHYRRLIAESATVILNGPAGVFERQAFADGTRELFEAATAVEHSVVGGGDTAAAIRALGIEGFSHVSTGGGAALAMLTGEELPAVTALEASPEPTGDGGAGEDVSPASGP